MKKEIIAIRKDILPGEKVQFKERMKDNGALTNIRVRFYPGVENDLKVSPYILHKGNRREDVLTYVEGSNMDISGDDDTFVFPVYLEFKYDDEFVVEAENKGGYSYTLVVDATVEYVLDGVEL